MVSVWKVNQQFLLSGLCALSCGLGAPEKKKKKVKAKWPCPKMMKFPPHVIFGFDFDWTFALTLHSKYRDISYIDIQPKYIGIWLLVDIAQPYSVVKNKNGLPLNWKYILL